MIEINFSSNFDQLASLLTDFERNQLPFAASRALTALAKDVQDAVKRRSGTAFDRPTPWTQNAFRTIPATKQTLTSVLLLKDRAGGTEVANEYLRLQEEGGTARPMPSRFGGTGKGVALVRPTMNAKRNAYGNLPFRALATLKKQKNTFVGPVIGRTSGKPVYGVWRRTGPKKRGLQLLIGFNDRRTYKQRFGYRDTVNSRAINQMAERMSEALNHALSTARRK